MSTPAQQLAPPSYTLREKATRAHLASKFADVDAAMGFRAGLIKAAHDFFTEVLGRTLWEDTEFEHQTGTKPESPTSHSLYFTYDEPDDPEPLKFRALWMSEAVKVKGEPDSHVIVPVMQLEQPDHPGNWTTVRTLEDIGRVLG